MADLFGLGLWETSPTQSAARIEHDVAGRACDGKRRAIRETLILVHAASHHGVTADRAASHGLKLFRSPRDS
jgi:hypothetical protein